jgi:hypothetical protein
MKTLTASMSRRLTVRLSAPAMRKIRRRARALGVTPSQLVRDMIVREVGAEGGEASLYDLTIKWVGYVRAPKVTRGRRAREALEQWTSDRRLDA